MTCEQVLLAIDAYLDEEVTPLEALTVEDHLRECDACRRVVETQASLHALLAADALQDEPPARLRRRIVSLITAEASRRVSSGRLHRSDRWPRLAIRLAGAAAVVLMAVTLPGTRGPGDHPLAGDLVREHDRSPGPGDLPPGLITDDARRAGRWLEDRLRRPVVVPSVAGPGARLIGVRVSTLAQRAAGHLVYRGEGRHTSLFIVPRLTIGGLEGSEREVEGVDVYTSTVGSLQLGWWSHGRDLYLAATDGDDEDLIGFASLCVRLWQLSGRGSPLPVTVSDLEGRGQLSGQRPRPPAQRPPLAFSRH